ncbi:hypothetical protein [Mesobacillus zeae]|uniref:hypothetical protein n=1 Tax=Mesobacillus zeae TaxID=1917180 RepID=UPI00300A5151
MSSKQPAFTQSPYFIHESGKWRIEPGAPAALVKEFKEFMENDEAEELEPVKKLTQEDLNEFLI